MMTQEEFNLIKNLQIQEIENSQKSFSYEEDVSMNSEANKSQRLMVTLFNNNCRIFHQKCTDINQMNMLGTYHPKLQANPSDSQARTRSTIK